MANTGRNLNLAFKCFEASAGHVQQEEALLRPIGRGQEARAAQTLRGQSVPIQMLPC